MNNDVVSIPPKLPDQHHHPRPTHPHQTAKGLVGFIYTTLNLIDRSIVHIIPPMLLPALAMCALAISDIRYLWLEHDAGTEGDDED